MNRRTHVLHIGKTGGTAVNAALSPYTESHGIILHGHDTKLSDVPLTDQVVFFLRDPVERFISGFNSRLRQGRPRNNNPWSAAESRAFDYFRTPNALAEALTSTVPTMLDAALAAMNDITHVNSRFTDWFAGPEELIERRNSILLLGLQPFLGSDFAFLKRTMGLPDALALPEDPIAAHRTPTAFEAELTPCGRANISHWYVSDIRFFEAYRQLRQNWFGGDFGRPSM